MSTNPYEPSIGPESQASVASTPAQREAVKDLLRWPAAILLVLSILSAIGQGGYVLATQSDAGGAQDPSDRLIHLVFMAFHAVVAIGARKMMRLESYRFAHAAAVASVIPLCSPCFVAGIPFGVWALLLLSREDVKAAFASSDEPDEPSPA